MQNKVIKEEFLQVKENSKRKRWYITMQCQKCNKKFTILKQPRGKHLTNPCETCAKRVIAYNKFIAKSLVKHGDRFDYSKVTENNYINLFEPVTIICKIHGEFQQKPKDHTNAHGGKQCCPDCIKDFNKKKELRSIHDWKLLLKEKASHVHLNSYEFLGGASDAEFECDYHGTFSGKLITISRSINVCPLCAQDNNSWAGRFRRTDIPGVIYHIYIPELKMWKLGVTSNSVKERFRQFPHSYEVLWIYETDTLKQAYLTEMQLFRKYKKHRNRTKHSDISGYTELLTCEIPITALRSSNTASKEP